MVEPKYRDTTSLSGTDNAEGEDASTEVDEDLDGSLNSKTASVGRLPVTVKGRAEALGSEPDKLRAAIAAFGGGGGGGLGMLFTIFFMVLWGQKGGMCVAFVLVLLDRRSSNRGEPFYALLCSKRQDRHLSILIDVTISSIFFVVPELPLEI